jgi:hypothetical protein
MWKLITLHLESIRCVIENFQKKEGFSGAAAAAGAGEGVVV